MSITDERPLKMFRAWYVRDRRGEVVHVFSNLTTKREAMKWLLKEEGETLHRGVFSVLPCVPPIEEGKE